MSCAASRPNSYDAQQVLSDLRAVADKTRFDRVIVDLAETLEERQISVLNGAHITGNAVMYLFCPDAPSNFAFMAENVVTKEFALSRAPYEIPAHKDYEAYRADGFTVIPLSAVSFVFGLIIDIAQGKLDAVLRARELLSDSSALASFMRISLVRCMKR